MTVTAFLCLRKLNARTSQHMEDEDKGEGSMSVGFDPVLQRVVVRVTAGNTCVVVGMTNNEWTRLNDFLKNEAVAQRRAASFPPATNQGA